MLDLFGNPEDSFCGGAAQLKGVKIEQAIMCMNEYLGLLLETV